MTTRVIIESPTENIKNVLIKADGASQTLRPGDKGEWYVYPGRMLVVSEVIEEEK